MNDVINAEMGVSSAGIFNWSTETQMFSGKSIPKTQHISSTSELNEIANKCLITNIYINGLSSSLHPYHDFR